MTQNAFELFLCASCSQKVPLGVRNTYLYSAADIRGEGAGSSLHLTQYSLLATGAVDLLPTSFIQYCTYSTWRRFSHNLTRYLCFSTYLAKRRKLQTTLPEESVHAVYIEIKHEHGGSCQNCCLTGASAYGSSPLFASRCSERCRKHRRWIVSQVE